MCTKQDQDREKGIQPSVSHALSDHHICHRVRPLGDQSYTSDKILNIFIYAYIYRLSISSYRTCKLLKIVQFFGPPCGDTIHVCRLV